jgi:hypothetical protein
MASLAVFATATAMQQTKAAVYLNGANDSARPIFRPAAQKESGILKGDVETNSI